MKKKRDRLLVELINANQLYRGAEIGCYRGRTTSRILKECPMKKYYAVDLWEFRPDILGEREKDIRAMEDLGQVFRDFRRVVGNPPALHVLRGISWEMAAEVEDESLDFIFIDADHCYSSVKKDIEAWVPKVRKDGLISGHDIHLYGVHKAVIEIFPDFINTGIDNVWLTWKK